MKSNENNTLTNVADKILTIGIDYKKPRGGIAQVLYVYSSFFEPFHFVRTVVDGNKFIKGIVFVEAIFHFLYYMLFKKIEIVHIHGASYASFWRKRVFIYMAILFKKKVVYHIHGGKFQLFAKNRNRTIQKTLLKCNCIIALSNNWKAYFMENYKYSKVIVIKNVIENPHICKDNSSTFTLLFLGYISKNKGIFDLLEAISQNKTSYENKLRLIIGGNGETNKIQDIITKNRLNNIVSFQGWVSGKKKIALLNMANAYILPSYNEGLPISILEAMSYALPIISTNVGGIPEIVKNEVNGFIIEPGDKSEINTSINTLMNNKSLREKMGAESAQIAKDYLPRCISQQLLKVYHNLLTK